MATAHGDILRSTDGARTWSTVFHTPACGPGRSAPLATSDGGRTWRHVSVPRGQFGPVQIARAVFPNPDTGWLVTVLGQVWRTADGGETWTRASGFPPGSVQSLSFPNPDDGWAMVFLKAMRPGPAAIRGGFTLVRTVDGGRVWTVVTALAWPPPRRRFMPGTITFSSANRGWAFGGRGLMTTADGGHTWVEIALPALFPRTLDFISPDRGWLLTGDGRLFSTADGGVNWRQIPT